MVAYYDRAFRDSIGTAAIIGAKKINGSNYQQLKPAIVRVRTRNDLATIFYTLQFLDGSRELASVTWQKPEGSWQLIYDSRLDTELSQFAENRVEIEENGALPAGPEDLSPAATRAGAAADQAQARFLEQDLEVSPP